MINTSDQDFRVEMYWGPYDTQLYSAKLMRHTQKHETRFSYDANPGSLESAFIVALLANGGYDIIKNHATYLLRRRKRAEAAGRDAPPAALTIDIDFPNLHFGDIDVDVDIDVDIGIFSEESTYEVEIESEEDVEEVEQVIQAAKEIEDER